MRGRVESGLKAKVERVTSYYEEAGPGPSEVYVSEEKWFVVNIEVTDFTEAEIAEVKTAVENLKRRLQ